MLQPDSDLLETNIQLNLLNFRQKFIAKLHVAGRSADQPAGLFGQFYHLSRKQYAQQFAGMENGPQLKSLPPLDITKSFKRYEHQMHIAAINLQLSAVTEVLTWMLQAVGPTIRAVLFDPVKGGRAHISIADILDYLELHHESFSSQDIFSLDGILNMRVAPQRHPNAEVSGGFVKPN